MQFPAAYARGPARPDVTGDFDNGVAASVDGPYINAPDPGDARATGSGGTSEPSWQAIEGEQAARAVTFAWTASPGQSCELETSAGLKNWTPQVRFRVGEAVDAPHGITRLHERLDVASVRLAVPVYYQALHARLRWVPE